MMEVRLMMISRFALARLSRLKASRTTPRKANRNNATANDPIVRSRRTFLRVRFAQIIRLNFMPHLQRGQIAEAPSLRRELPSPDGVWCERAKQRPGRASP